MLGRDDFKKSTRWSLNLILLISGFFSSSLTMTNHQENTTSRYKAAFTRVKLLRLKSGGIVNLAFSPDGNEFLAVGWKDNAIHFFETGNWTSTGKLKFDRYSPTTVSYSPDNRLFAVTDGGVEFFDAKTRRKLTAYEPENEKPKSGMDSSRVPFSPDAKFFAVGTSWKDAFWLKLLEITPNGMRSVRSTMRPRWTEYGYPAAYGLDFSPDGRFLAVGSGDGTLELWDVKNWKLLRRYQVPTTRAESGLAWDSKTWKLSRRHRFTPLAHVGWVGYVDFSPDGELLASADGRHESSVKIWKVRTGRLVHSWLLSDDPSDQTRGLAFSPDGKILAACSLKKVALFEVATARELWSKEAPGGFNSVAFSPTGHLFAFPNYPDHSGKTELEVWQYSLPGRSVAHK